ncbi:MAG: thioredoxin family protein [Sulfuriferula multivorans]|uniref:Thioredoxin family protein n=1 Tax=Sulfuriferula multivorans TaxID=1559896 RepID=A0A7C9TDZ3_9PROT|nr:thioredoxin family protein [Sulfuriferula multivorans]
MDVKIVATKVCSHYPGLLSELKDMGVMCEVLFVEEHPEIVELHVIRHSPNLMVNGKVVFRRQPTPLELRNFFGKPK